MKTFKIGTRGSLLAVTQSSLILNELEKISGHRFELVKIKTQGDEITNKPLWQLEGKDFFTKELDEALLSGAVDLVVHSYKDLGSVRPEGIELAAITERRFAHDILFINKDSIPKLKNWSGVFKIGTSSPRRIVNITKSIASYIPHFSENNIKIECEMLRGNVNTRLGKLKNNQYDAIILALAGIERLAHTEESKKELSELLSGMNYMILPQSAFPSAASQGALGIETYAHRNDNGELKSYINKLFHAPTGEEVKREREAFKSYGGGCHLAVGIHVKKVKDFYLHIHSGEVDGKRIEKKYLEGAQDFTGKFNKIFVGLPQTKITGAVTDEYLDKKPVINHFESSGKHLFVTSKHTLENLSQNHPEKAQGLWAAGTKTWKELVKAGHWVNGCSDSLGVQDLEMVKTSLALQIIHPKLDGSWIVLSHTEAESPLGKVIPSYDRIPTKTEESWKSDLLSAEAYFWTSFPQYQHYVEAFPEIRPKSHFCGLGKTYDEFYKAGISIHPLAGMDQINSLLKVNL
ncbi:MAG: hydroxymethylbilane synthase [Bacteriovoracaceae bacterium]